MPRAALPAKLQPRRQAQALDRERLFRRLDAADDRALVWIEGPAGAGKTTLVSSWLARGPRGVVWYRADAGDADLATAFAFLAQATGAATRKRTLRLPALTPEYLLDVPGFTRRFMRLMCAALPHDCVLVVDGIEQAPGDVLTGLLPAAMGELLPGQRLVVTSREGPPAALARGRVEGAVDVIGWRDLKLDADEAVALATPLAVTSADALRLHRLCGGWAAGFTLGLHHLRTQGSLAVPASAWLEEQLFPYFASEMFEQADVTTQAVLLASALLPSFDVDALAVLLPGIDARPVVQGLYRRHFFIDRSDASPPTYRYHDLFREFLLQQGRERLPAEERRRLLRQGADHLLKSSHAEDAAPLLLEAQAWDEAVALWCRLAPGLLMQGRHAVLARGLLDLPQTRLDADPWALYWLGTAQQPVAPAEARAALQAAYALFHTRADRVGCLLACSAVIQGYLIEYADITPADQWAGALEEALFGSPEPLPPEVEIEGLNAAVVLMVRCVHRELADRAFERGLALQQQPLSPALRFRVAFYVLQARNFRGEWREAMALIAEFDRAIASGELPPLARLVWASAASPVQAGAGDFEAALLSAKRVQEDANRYNIGMFRLWAAGNVGLCAMQRGDLKTAEAALAEMRQRKSGLRLIERAHAGYLDGVLASCRGDLRVAEELIAAALRDAEEGGVRLWTVPACVALATVQVERGRLQAALKSIEAVVDIAEASYHTMLRQTAQLVSAWIAQRSHDEDAAVALLRVALQTGRERGFKMVFPWCPPAMLQELGQLALREGIEPDLMREMLALRRIAPPSPDADPWPWPLRVRSLGRFEVERAGQPLTWGAKLPRKPLELLQALLALDGGSGHGAPVTALIDLLWPDSEGDAAQNAFNVALSRLRKLLGDAQALQQRDGRLVLDGDRVWTDVAALRRLAERVDDAEQAQDAQVLAERLLDVYRGPFLADHSAPWSAACRQRQLARFRRAVGRLIDRLQQGQHEDAVRRLRERSLQRDADSERADDPEATAPQRQLKVVRR